MSNCRSQEHLEEAARSFQKAAQAFADQVLGGETTNHLREAARSMIRGVRSACDRAEAELDRNAPGAKGNQAQQSHEAAQPPAADAPRA
jgi:hypothetical protein